MQNLWKGQKVNEKVLGKVLISSLCGIFLCLACLVGTTWAWYVVDIENPENTIEIAQITAEVRVDEAAPSREGMYTLSNGTHMLEIKPDNQTTAAYVVMSVNGKETCYFTFENGQIAPVKMEVVVHDAEATFSFATQWTKPDKIAEAGTALTVGTAPIEMNG